VASVLGFVADIMGRWTGTDGQHLATNFRPFLKFLGRRDLTDALKMASLAKRHGIVPMLGDADEEALADACRDRLVPARDAAITLLALPTGMRACDIIGLKTGDIDWRTSTLTIVQRKTGNPLTAPLLPAVAEALAEYILAERPGHGVRQRVRVHEGAAPPLQGPCGDLFRDRADVSRGGRRRCGHAAAQAQRGVEDAALGRRAAGDIGGARTCGPRHHQRLHGGRCRTHARMRAAPTERGDRMRGYPYSSAFAGDITAFIEFKASVGIASASRNRTLYGFDRHCAGRGLTSFGRETVEGWVKARKAAVPSGHLSWMSHIRELGRFMRANGHPDAYVLSERFKAKTVRVTPYLLTQGEVDAFFDAAAHFDNGTPWTWQASCFFGLMQACGLRTCEARRLRVCDVDYDAPSIDVMWSKGNRSRRLSVTGRGRRDDGALRRQDVCCLRDGPPRVLRRLDGQPREPVRRGHRVPSHLGGGRTPRIKGRQASAPI